MKTFKLLLMAAILSAGMLVSCSQTDKYQSNIDKLEKLISELESKSDLSPADWKNAEKTFKELEIDEDQLKNMTDEQAEEYGQLMGRYARVAIKQGIKQSEDVIDKAGSLLNGILKGLGTNDEEDD